MSRRYRTTLLMGVVFVGLLAWVLFRERGRVTEKGEIFRLQLTEVSQIRVEGKNHSYTLARQGDEWWFREPFQGLAASYEAERTVRAVAALKPLKRENQDLTKPEFGLQDPQLTVTVTYRGDRTTVIKLGQQSPLGQKIFATISQEPQGLFLIDQSFLTDVDRDPETMREKKLATKVTLENVTQVTVHKGEEQVTANLVPLAQETTWQIVAPRVLKADKTAVESLITSLSYAEALEFMPYTTENLTATGLDKPQVVLTYNLKKGNPVTIYLGKEEQRTVKTTGSTTANPQQVVYATRWGRPEILVMNVSVLSDLNKGLFDLRDKHILPGLKKEQVTSLKAQREAGLSFSVMKSGNEWQVTAPRAGKAKSSKVDDVLYALVDLQATGYVVENDPNVDLAKYGLKLPQTTLTVGVEGRSTPIILWIGAPVPEKTERFYLRTSLANDVYEIDGALLRDLPQTAEDLLEPPSTTPSTGSSSSGGGTTPAPGG